MLLKLYATTVALSLIAVSCSPKAPIRLEMVQPVYPVLTLKEHNPVLKLQAIRENADSYVLQHLKFNLTGTTQIDCENRCHCSLAEKMEDLLRNSSSDRPLRRLRKSFSQANTLWIPTH